MLVVDTQMARLTLYQAVAEVLVQQVRMVDRLKVVQQEMVVLV
jgi:hypothetical protein